MNSNDPLKREAFDVLFPCLWKLLEATPTIPRHPNKLFYGKGIVVTITREICSICALLNPLPVPTVTGSTVTDPVSISVIARTILEAYLVWEQIFILPDDEEQKEYWYLTWALKSLKLHTQTPPTVPDLELDQEDPDGGGIKKMKAIDVYNNIVKVSQDLETQIRDNAYFKIVMGSGDVTTRGRYQGHARDGWKASPEFLLKRSMKYFHSSKIYDLLSAASHIDHLSVRQLVMSLTSQEKKQYAESSLLVVLVVIARLCEQFPLVFPSPAASTIVNDPNVQKWIGAYREVADR